MIEPFRGKLFFLRSFKGGKFAGGLELPMIFCLAWDRLAKRYGAIGIENGSLPNPPNSFSTSATAGQSLSLTLSSIL
jgi:hypothetical protein